MSWRLRLALETAGISVQEMADSLGYSRSTLSRWLNGQDEPRAAALAQWAMLTEVDREWLVTGEGSQTTPPPGGGVPDPGPLAAAAEKRRRRASRSYADTSQYRDAA